jgi:hypothetical protein
MSPHQQLLLNFETKPAADTAKTSTSENGAERMTPSIVSRIDEATSRHTASIEPLVLKWDFRTSFPPPLEAAIEAGKLDESDVLPANLKSLHQEYEGTMLGILADLDVISDARRRGVDPSTSKPPRTEKRRIALEQRFKDEPSRLQHALEVMIDAYAEGFGDEAAGEFRKAIVARHHGVDVLADSPVPLREPLAASVNAGVFGHEEDGSPVNPSVEEIDEITLDLAERLQDLPDDSPKRAELFQQYAADFGQEAAAMLDEWLRRRAKLEETISTDEYDPGHPWHYYQKGDGADPIDLGDIPPAEMKLEQLGVKLPKAAAKRREKIAEMISDAKRQLELDEARYEELVDCGVDALSDYDRNIAHHGNDELAWASAVALKYNHIRFGRGRVNLLMRGT